MPAVVRLCLFCYLPISIDLCFLKNEPTCVPSGEEAATGIVASITPGNPTIVSCVDDEKMDFQVLCATCPHGLAVATVSRQQPKISLPCLQDGQMVTFAEVDGMSQLNDKTPRRIKNVKVGVIPIFRYTSVISHTEDLYIVIPAGIWLLAKMGVQRKLYPDRMHIVEVSCLLYGRCKPTLLS